MNRTKQLLNNFEDWKLKKFKQLQSWGMSLVAQKSMFYLTFSGEENDDIEIFFVYLRNLDSYWYICYLINQR